MFKKNLYLITEHMLIFIIHELHLLEKIFKIFFDVISVIVIFNFDKKRMRIGVNFH